MTDKHTPWADLRAAALETEGIIAAKRLREKGWIPARVADALEAAIDCLPDDGEQADSAPSLAAELARVREAADNVCACLETVMAHYGDQMPPTDRSVREAAITSVRALLGPAGNRPGYWMPGECEDCAAPTWGEALCEQCAALSPSGAEPAGQKGERP